MSSNQSLSKQSMTLIAARGISLFLTLGIPLVLVRYLTQSEFGSYKQSILLFTTAITLLPFGMSQSLYYFIPKEPENRAGYLANSFLFLLCAGSLPLIVSIFAGSALEQYFHSAQLADAAPMIGLYSFFMIASIYCETALISENRVQAAAVIILLSETAKASALIGSAIFLRSFKGVMICLAIAAAVRFVLLSTYFYKDIKIALKGPNLSLFRKQLKYSIPFGLMVLVAFVQDFFHQYYISYSFSPAEFAIYAVGCLQLPMVELFYSSIGDVAMVKMAERLRVNDREGARNLWHEAMLKLALIFFPLVFFLWVVSDQFITALFTESYRASVPIFAVSITGLLFTTLLVDPVMRVFGVSEMRFMLLITVFRFPITIATAIIGLAAFGMIGAAASTVAMVLLVRIAALARICRVMRTGIKDLLPWSSLTLIFVAALIAAVPTYLASELPLSPKFTLLATAPIYGLTFLLASLWFNVIPSEERQIVKDAIGKMRSLIFSTQISQVNAKRSEG